MLSDRPFGQSTSSPQTDAGMTVGTARQLGASAGGLGQWHHRPEPDHQSGFEGVRQGAGAGTTVRRARGRLSGHEATGPVGPGGTPWSREGSCNDALPINDRGLMLPVSAS